LIACRNCGTTFLPKRNDADYCSPTHSETAFRRVDEPELRLDGT